MSGGTVKVLKKLAGQIQAGTAYEEDALFLLPITGGAVGQTYDPIDDTSISGEAFMDIPQQGPRHVAGSGLGFQIDKISCPTILEAAFGTNTSEVFTLGTNAKKLSLVGIDDVKENQYANCFVSKLSIAGATGGLWLFNVDVVNETAESRNALGTFPSNTAYDEPFTFHEAGGVNGYVRVGDADDALAAGDNICIEDFSLEINNGFADQHSSCSLGTLTPVFGMSPPSVSGSFKVARHESDQYQIWEDNHTPLQMCIYIYKDATATFKIEVPRFVISVGLSDEDVTRVDCEMKIGRNGVGTSYKNANMSFTSPVRITVINS